jgi:hypothetical protein
MAVVGDIDEERKAIRVRPDAEKNQRYRYLNLPDDLFAALVATLPPHEDRDAAEPLSPGVTDANLRMAIARACRDGGVPHFTPHGLRRRRGSLHYKRTGSLAEVAELLRDFKARRGRSLRLRARRLSRNRAARCPRAPLPLGQTCPHGACTGACTGASQLLIAGMFYTCTAFPASRSPTGR